jgi:predicted ATPase/transcriptional regulator with XRE-family HTH domain
MTPAWPTPTDLATYTARERGNNPPRSLVLARVDLAPELALGDLLRDHRHSAGLTQEQLAERAGVSPRSISDLERGGGHVPRRDTVRLLARALSLDGQARRMLESSVERHRKTLRVERRPIAEEHPPATPPEAPAPGQHNVPRALTSFVGRDVELDRLATALIATPLLTLVGAGGIGKTRLAHELVRRHHGQFPDGCWVVELGSLADAALLPVAVAAAVGLRSERVHDLLGALTDYLGGKQILLVLDNCEHLIEASAQLAANLLGKCPRLHILATSREPLLIGGESIWKVKPLEVPQRAQAATLDELAANPAVRLFFDRARAAGASINLTPDNAPAIARICQSVDGIPLAIELAAAWAHVLSIQQLADRLNEDVGLLHSTNRSIPPRHRAMRATIDWSYELLTERERTLLNRLSVFAGGWTLEAVEEVCHGDDVNRAELLDLLGQLVEKSMVVVDALGVETRYRMLQPIGQFARERLEASGEADAYSRQHAAYFLDLASSGPVNPAGPGEVNSLDGFEREHANLRVALRWALDHADTMRALQAAAGLFRYWERRGHFQEGCAWLEQALAQEGAGSAPVTVRADALNALAFLYWRGGDASRAAPVADQALALSQSVGHTRGIAQALVNLGMAAYLRGDYARAVELLEEAVALARELDRIPLLSVALTFLGRALLWLRGPRDGRVTRVLAEGQRLADSVGSRYASGHALATRGDQEWLLCHTSHSVALWRQALSAFAELADRRGVAGCLERLAIALSAAGKPETAAWLFGAAYVQHEGLGIQLRGREMVNHAHFATFIQQEVARETYAAAWSMGRSASVAESVTRALKATEGLMEHTSEASMMTCPPPPGIELLAA